MTEQEPEPQLDAPLPAEKPSTAFVTRLIRLHNLAIVLVVATALAALAIAQTGNDLTVSPAMRRALFIARIALPIAALLVTAFFTNRKLDRCTKQAGSQRVTFDAVAGVFTRSKRFSITLLTLAGGFAAACLVVRHQIVDFVLAAAPMFLLLISRPSPHGFTNFLGLAEMTREEMVAGDETSKSDEEPDSSTQTPDN